MEFMGFKECMNFLLGYGIVITSFISDRHVSIASHMRKVLTGITHYFDIWHLKKSKKQLKHGSVILINKSVIKLLPVSVSFSVSYIGSGH